MAEENRQEASVHLPLEAAYDRWSSLYDQYDNPMVFAASRVLALRYGNVSGLDVVEFGCGTGRNLAALKAAGARSLTGFDLSEGMLAKARERDPAFRLFRHDMTAPLPWPDGSADLVLFCLTLEHVADPAKPLAEARRLLRTGGRVVAVEIHPSLSQGGVAAHFKDAGGEVRMPTFPHSLADHRQAFQTAGLELTECRDWRPCDFAGPVPPKALKRGADFPLVVELVARPGT